MRLFINFENKFCWGEKIEIFETTSASIARARKVNFPTFLADRPQTDQPTDEHGVNGKKNSIMPLEIFTDFENNNTE